MFFLSLIRSSRPKNTIFINNILCVKHLFTPPSLGIDNFLFRRDKTENRYQKSKQSFIETMSNYCESTERSYNIYTEDLRNMIYLCNNDSQDLELLMKMTRKYVSGQQDRIIEFKFGPEVMRLYFHLNLPKEAKQIMHDEELKDFFSQVSSYTIYMTLQYNSGFYQEVLDAMHKMISERVSFKVLPRANFILTLAACYKMNSPKSLEEALSFINKSEESGGKMDAKITSFVSALALKQGRPHIALELITKSHSVSYLLRNIKAEALTQLGRSEDALPILRSYTDTASTGLSKSTEEGTILASTIDCVERALTQEAKKETLSEFDLIKSALQKKSLVLKKSIEEVLCEPIDLDGGQGGGATTKFSERQKNRAMMAAAFQQGKNRHSERKNDRYQRKGFSNFE